jgi:hypothetical protein
MEEHMALTFKFYWSKIKVDLTSEELGEQE